MRTVIYGGACSLDSFLAGPNGEIDWLHFSKDVQEVMAKTWATADTILFGRKTWEFAVAMGGNSGAMPGMKSYVFSRTISSIDDPNVELVREDAREFVRALKSEPGKDMVVMSGGTLARSLIDAELVDQIGLNVHPLLLGGGVPAFQPSSFRVPLELVECRRMDGGCVLVTYRVPPRTVP